MAGEFLDPVEIATLASALYDGRAGAQLQSVRCLPNESAASDGASVYLLDDRFVMLISQDSFPHSMAEQAAAMRSMSERLGQSATPILRLCAEGNLRGRSYLVVPRCKPLASSRIRGRLDRRFVRGDVLAWLRDVVTLADAPNRAAAQEFSHSLMALSATPGLPSSIVSAADHLNRLLGEDRFAVGHVPMHGDLWHGNLMRKPDGSLAIIDWGGSATHGYGLYDLIRIGDSLGIPPARMKREIAWHAEALGGGREVAELHLLAALGHYARRLGQFPLNRFVGLAGHCFDLFERFS